MQAEAVEYAQTRDPALKQQIVEAHQPLVHRCARRMQARGEPLEDVIQVCNVGLLEALERYDPGKGAAFHTYADVTMRGVVRHYYRSTWRTHVPRSVQELHRTVAEIRGSLREDLQREPSVDELADRAGVSVAEVQEAIAAGDWPHSIETLADAELPADVRNESAVGRVETLTLLDRLADLPRTVLYLRYFAEQTQAEVAVTLGVSPMAVHRAERAGLTRLRALAA